MPPDSDKWLEEARRKLDQEGFPCEDTDELLRDVARYGAMSVDDLMWQAQCIALAMENHGRLDLSIAVGVCIAAVRLQLEFDDDEGEGKDE